MQGNYCRQKEILFLKNRIKPIHLKKYTKKSTAFLSLPLIICFAVTIHAAEASSR